MIYYICVICHCGINLLYLEIWATIYYWKHQIKINIELGTKK